MKKVRFVFYEQSFQSMGSPCEIKLYANTRTRAGHVANLAIREAMRLEALYSRYRADSFLSEINRIAARGGSIEVDPETAGLLDYVEACYRESGGLFDITSGLLRHAWKFSEAQLPDPKDIEAILEKVGWHRLVWNKPILEFPAPGLELDMGGAVKEYAVDRIATLCWNAGLRHGLINLGGDIRVLGPHPDGSPWVIGIQHPWQRGEYIQTLTLYHGAMASSGDYERCIVVNGIRYSHVLNPRTGWPCSHLAAVSVIADLCVVAGSAATIALLKGKSGPEWLSSLKIPHFWVDNHGEVGGNLTGNS